ncbi:putative conserved integral membrane transport protein [Mycobacterium ulcerans str. Harvey]|uniref:Conserved integral membrane transport protein n=1 Tax=Mycobacterium ulcerans str. Harvey TaxID=1299332 RepID=A0ABN0R6R1_MYCUL|nr:putative conserved integral membrane transport protein [Mycobacterium ulcerans str. Harvey]
MGLALLTLDFRMTVLGASAVFAVLTSAQLMALPQHLADPDTKNESILQGWKAIVCNRSFLGFAAAMTGAYVLSFQVYLALPIQASLLAPGHQSVLLAAMFAVSGLIAIAGQLRITRWVAAHWRVSRSLVVGLRSWPWRSCRLRWCLTRNVSAPVPRSRRCWYLRVCSLSLRRRCFPSKCAPWWCWPKTNSWRRTMASTAR